MAHTPNRNTYTSKAIALIVLSLSFFSCLTTKQIEPRVEYSDTTITLSQQIDTFHIQVIHDTIFTTKDSVTIQIQTDTIEKVRIIYRKPETRIVLDSVIKWKTIKHNEIIRITHHQCTSAFHNFCVGFFWLTAILLLIRTILKSLL